MLFSDLIKYPTLCIVIHNTLGCAFHSCEKEWVYFYQKGKQRYYCVFILLKLPNHATHSLGIPNLNFFLHIIFLLFIQMYSFIPIHYKLRKNICLPVHVGSDKFHCT